MVVLLLADVVIGGAIAIVWLMPLYKLFIVWLLLVFIYYKY